MVALLVPFKPSGQGYQASKKGIHYQLVGPLEPSVIGGELLLRIQEEVEAISGRVGHAMQKRLTTLCKADTPCNRCTLPGVLWLGCVWFTCYFVDGKSLHRQ